MFCLTPQLRLMGQGQTRTFERYVVPLFAGIANKSIPGFTPYNPSQVIGTLRSGNTSSHTFRTQMALWGLSQDGNFGQFSPANSSAPVVSQFAAALADASAVSLLNSARESSRYLSVIYVPVRNTGTANAPAWTFDERNQVLGGGEFETASQPVPEPMTLALGAAGLLAAIRRKRTRRNPR